jgi:hypothetical protein
MIWISAELIAALATGDNIITQKPRIAAALIAAIMISALVTSSPVMAQDVAAPLAETPKLATDGTQCELHIWPTENYLGVNMGLLSGLGPIGAVADMASHKDRVQTVKELMREYLGPDVQMAELNKMGITKILKLDGYKIVMQEATPFNEDAKKDPALKAKVKAMNAKIKAKKRLSDSTATCYAELATTHIFYHKAMMYGSNLFTGWIYREFGDKPLATKVSTGQVKNPLEYFPPKTPADIDTAKVELRDAYSKDFAEYVDKKVFGVEAKKK